MQLFECQGCGSALHFENSQCLTCARAVGYLQDRFVMSALEGGAAHFHALGAGGKDYRYCDNAAHGVCNWCVPAESSERYCEACRHNHLVPDLTIAENLVRWRKIELAKRYVVRSLLRWRLPHPNKADDPERGLAFDFLGDIESGGGAAARVMTGHDNGLITLNVVEGDDAEREKRRTSLGEPYRTLVGHIRHEIGHYYWDRLVRDRGRIDDCRELFGDESANYADALQRYYREGPPADWMIRYISSYASSHPFEDFAETWAHYLHIVDTLETAGAFGLKVKPRRARGALAAAIDFDPYKSSRMDKLVDAWLPIEFATNSMNRSMGLTDLYPFLLSPRAIEKLGFIHALTHRQEGALRKVS
jgi:hypothetical protein